jgi:3-oxoacyl-[acyl-carrier protein] reductase
MIRNGMAAKIQHAVITGGTGSLGAAIAKALASPDWKTESPSRAELDVSDGISIDRYFENREVDLLVCSAGITRDAPLVKMTESAWDETWLVNYQGSLKCAEAVLPDMITRGSGHIVFISSYSAVHPPSGQANYAASKAALIGLTTDLASRHGPHNIRVNTILPGFLETRMTESLTEKRTAKIRADHTLGRFNTCHRVASFVRFLHHELPHTSGQVFQLDSRTDFPRFPQQ